MAKLLEGVGKWKPGKRKPGKPKPGKPCKVSVLEINWELFKKSRVDRKQEYVRELIMQAKEEAERNPEKYPLVFWIFIPRKIWFDCSWGVKWVNQYSEDCGGHTADWVELALLWAWRLSNGESWKRLCNCPDRSRWCLLIKWKEEDVWVTAGSSPRMRRDGYRYPEGFIDTTDYLSYNCVVNQSVPLVVSYESTLHNLPGTWWRALLYRWR